MNNENKSRKYTKKQEHQSCPPLLFQNYFIFLHGHMNMLKE